MKRTINKYVTALFIIAIAGQGFPEEHIMHPVFKLLNKNKEVILNSGKTISTVETCAPCHNTAFINKHSTHYNDRVKADCIDCHFKGSRLKGNYKKANRLIQKPDNSNCAHCHGVTAQRCPQPLKIPDDFLENLDYAPGKKNYGLTQDSGEIFAPQNISDSDMNIKEKESLKYPWDVHSRRQLSCVDCHFTANDPRNCGTIRSDLDHLTRDPRKIKPTGKYLKYPDHKLVSAECQCCHNSDVVHKQLPFNKKHMQTLSCQSCHTSVLYGPAFKSVDRTVVKPDGSARIEFRNINKNIRSKDNINTSLIEGYIPDLFSHRQEDKRHTHNKINNNHKISPFNLVTNWYWMSEITGKEVPEKILRRIYLKNKSYRDDIITRFDNNKNGKIDPLELVLDTSEKIDFIKLKLYEAGIEKPVIVGKIKATRIHHGIVHEKQVVKDCTSCHGETSRMGNDIALSGMTPAGVVPEFDKDSEVLVNGKIIKDKKGMLYLKRNSEMKSHYVFGFSRISIIDILGFLIFVLSAMGITGHAVFRYISMKGHVPHRSSSERIYMYGFYERLWHWTMAAGVIILILTGMEIHFPGFFAFLGLEYAVSIHNVIGFVFVINALLSIFYHLTTGEIKQFFRVDRYFLKETVLQAMYYLYGIFRGEPHPLEKTVDRKLNPLQQITYTGLLYVLIPFQAITGVFIWSAGRWPEYASNIGGLGIVAPLHVLGSWLMLAFLVVHLYLITTGHTLTSNLRAMATGFDEVEVSSESDDQKKIMDLELVELIRIFINKILRRDQLKEVSND